VLDRVAGFGPLQRYLDDPEIEEIWVNERLAPGSARAMQR
jgi:type IV secretory pathway ATPase VirB11/archaellum biosynthesis ATPase